MLGVDKNRYAYLLINFVPKGVRSFEVDKLDRIIFKFDETGNVVNTFRLIKGTKNHAHRDVLLCYDGRLYHLWFGESEAVLYVLN